MSAEKFVASDWIDRLVPALARLAEAQEPYGRVAGKSRACMSHMTGGTANHWPFL